MDEADEVNEVRSGRDEKADDADDADENGSRGMGSRPFLSFLVHFRPSLAHDWPESFPRPWLALPNYLIRWNF